MNSTTNLQVAKAFLAKIGSGASPDEVATLFSADLDWSIPGDAGVLPWVGHKSGRQAVADFVRDSASMVERISFEVHDVLANDERAVILGGLSTRIKSTGKIINTAFAIILTIVGGEITHFLMLEDSLATSRAARNAAR
ncbi:MAG: ketosteroid isomerase [Gammaproteobacteria bacterium]|nr:ketosteroid isomerase [Gammaproteobacteria bacterium]